VFDIRQGVGIALFIKKKNIQSEVKIFYADLWGLREDKYKWLEENDLKTVSWKHLHPSSPYYFFIPRDIRHEKGYNKFVKISDIFPVNVTGIVTARDHFVIGFSYSELRRRIETFKNLSIPDDFIEQSYKLKDTRSWKLIEKRKELTEDKDWSNKFQKILYRPFDVREIYYSQLMVDWPRPEVMPNMLKDNLGIITARSNKSNHMDHFFVTDKIMETKCGESTTQSCLFPLYRYSNNDKKGLFENINREPNINSKLFDMFVGEGLKPSPTPEQIFYYIYAILYSNIYRNKYSDFLKSDFPRIPFTSDKNMFKEMVKLGEELAAIHLLKSPHLDKTFSKFEISGDNVVKKIQYSCVGAGSSRPNSGGNVFINDSQYFSCIPSAVWEYQIGGYQVMAKWLKDRKGRALSLDDIRHYIRIAKALQLTIEIQLKIDKIYPQIEKKVILFYN
jgi:predicted helicase